MAPGRFGGDDKWAASGFLFWPLVGFALGQAQRRGRRAAANLAVWIVTFRKQADRA